MNHLNAFLSSAKLVFLTHPPQHRQFVHNLENQHFVIEPAQRKRMVQGTVISAVTNHWFSVLRGKSVNENERFCAFVVGAATPLYDDLLDEAGLSHEAIIRAIEDEHHPHRNQIVLFHHLMQQAFDHIYLARDYRRYFELVVRSQKESQRQELPQPLDSNELTRLTAEKGGYATLLFRHILENPLREGEEDAIFALGQLLQYINDIFGLWFDLQKNRQTLITHSSNVSEMRETFYRLFEEMTSLSLSMDYPKRNTLDFLKLVSLVASRALVSLDHYDQLSAGSSTFNTKGFSRQQLVCDMEKLSSLTANMRHSIKLYNSFVKGK
ncbi:MAG: hypothetical protein H3C41_07865 [Bacteroidales bacterium]|nr:hypothetical protein [Bacteroidales bacterium]